jgi:hypothetical protein
MTTRKQFRSQICVWWGAISNKKPGTPLPASLSGSTVKRPVEIDGALLYLVGGALSGLASNEPFEQTGTLTADETRQALEAMILAFYGGECETTTSGGSMEKVGTVQVGVTGLASMPFTIPYGYSNLIFHCSLKTTYNVSNTDDVRVTINGDENPANYYSEGRFAIGTNTTWTGYYYPGNQPGMVMRRAASTNYGNSAMLFSSVTVTMLNVSLVGARYRPMHFNGHMQSEIFGSNLRGHSLIGGGDYMGDTNAPITAVNFAPMYGEKFEYLSTITAYGLK